VQPERDIEPPGRRRRTAGADLFAAAGREVWSVTEITRRIKERLEESFSSVWIAGEASNVRRPASGHVYLTLKDEGAQLNAVIWRGLVGKLRFDLEDGLALVVQGEITVYAPRGQYQLICRQVYPKGMGALELAFRQLRDRLEKEGLFAPEHKKPLPFLPRRIGIVTSGTGAALRDILRVLDKRFPPIPVLIAPVRVQGEGAAGDIAEAIGLMNRQPDVDCLIVGRGGGSLEDLWAFNEEVVARAIYASRVPVISGVGHEIDLTIADLVADVRALTPTDAAQQAVPDRLQLAEQTDALAARLVQALRGRVQTAADALRAAGDAYAFRRPLELVRRREQAADAVCERLAVLGRRLLPDRLRALEAVAGRLEALGPRNVLARGYSITMTGPNGTILKRAGDVAPGDSLRTLLHQGEVRSRVTALSNEDNDGGETQRG